MIHVICDTTVSLPESYCKQYPNLHLVSLAVALGGEYIPENGLSAEDVIQFVERTGEQPLTSQPSIGEVQEVVSQIPETDGIIMIGVTGGVSGTIRTMQAVAAQSGRKRIVALDSHTTAVGMRFLIDDALQMIADGVDFDSIVRALERSIRNTRTMFVPSTLRYLERGGRIGKAAMLLGTLLKINPIIYVNDDNQVDVLDKIRTTKKAYARMMSEALSRPVRKLAVVHLMGQKKAEEISAELQEQVDVPLYPVTTGSASLACHLGPDLIAIMVEWEPKEDEDVQSN